VDEESKAALRDALEALKRAEKLLELIDRPSLARLPPIVRAVEEFAERHAAVSLDLRIARLRIQAMLPEEQPPREDPDKTPVEGARRLSEQLAAVRPPEGPLPPPGKPRGRGRS
jgi:hypothetical protein